MSYQNKPSPSDPWEIQRWTHTSLRHRMLTGSWSTDLRAKVTDQIGPTLSNLIGEPDISSNVFASVCTSLAALYDVVPSINNATDPQAAGLLSRMLVEAAWGAQMQTFQRLTLGLREMVMRVDAIEAPEMEGGVRLILRPVTPDHVIGRPRMDRPAEFIVYEETVYREVSPGVFAWTWDVFDVSDPESPSYRVLSADRKTDLTMQLCSQEFQGPSYPWRTQAGLSVVPAIVYHAEYSASKLFDPFAWKELVDGTLQIGVDRSNYHRSLRSAAYPQRYLINAVVPADIAADGRHEVVTDPSAVLILSGADGAGQPVAGQWASAFDPVSFQEAVSKDEARLAMHSGIPASDLLRLSDDPRSGLAITVSREGRRDAQRRFSPPFQMGDQALFSMIAIVVNALLGTEVLPERGWAVRYNSIPETEDERTKREDRILAQLQAGIISLAEARAKIVGGTVEDANRALATMNAGNGNQGA